MREVSGRQSDFSDAITLATIIKTPGEHFETLIPSIARAFKYYRFIFSPEELKIPHDGDGASISEIEFITPSGQRLNGEPIGHLVANTIRTNQSTALMETH